MLPMDGMPARSSQSCAPFRGDRLHCVQQIVRDTAAQIDS